MNNNSNNSNNGNQTNNSDNQANNSNNETNYVPSSIFTSSESRDEIIQLIKEING